MIIFSNDPIDLSVLPQAETIEFLPLERDFLTVQRITFYLTVFIVLSAATTLFLLVDDEPAWVPLLTAGILFSIFIWWWLAFTISFRYSGYAFRQHDVMVRKGWLVRKTRVVPLNRVQHVSVQSGPIERKYKLASVSVYSAGSDHADVTIRGINEERAQELKNWINSRINDSTNGETPATV